MILCYPLELDEGSAGDGEIPAVFDMSSFCELLVNLRIASATFSPTLGGRGAPALPLPLVTCTAYSSSCRLNPAFGHTIPRLARTAASASSAVILVVAIRYAQITVALRLMPMRQWT